MHAARDRQRDRHGVEDDMQKIIILKPLLQLTGVLSSVGEPPDYLIATDEDIDNLFISKDGKNG